MMNYDGILALANEFGVDPSVMKSLAVSVVQLAEAELSVNPEFVMSTEWMNNAVLECSLKALHFYEEVMDNEVEYQKFSDNVFNMLEAQA